MDDEVKAQKWLESFEWDNIPEADEHLTTICEALQDAAAYRTMEKKKTLLIVPCAIGSTVYIPRNYYYIGLKKVKEKKILRATVVRIVVSDEGIAIITRNGSDTREFSAGDFGKIVFTDEKQAEWELSQMKNEIGDRLISDKVCQDFRCSYSVNCPMKRSCDSKCPFQVCSMCHKPECKKSPANTDSLKVGEMNV